MTSFYSDDYEREKYFLKLTYVTRFPKITIVTSIATVTIDVMTLIIISSTVYVTSFFTIFPEFSSITFYMKGKKETMTFWHVK